MYKQVGRLQGNKDKQYIRAKEEKGRGRERENEFINRQDVYKETRTNGP